jgi:predicted peptidase
MSHPLHLLCALVLVPVSVVAGCANVKRSAPAPETSRGFVFGEQPLPGGGAVNYAVYVPRDYPKRGGPMPCILFLHGQGESGTDGNKQIIQGIGSAVQWNAKEWPFIIVFPQKPDPSRQWDDYGADVMEILARVKGQWNIDEDRVYLTGLSQGGHGTWALAAANPGVFAAIAPICGYPKPMTPEAIAGSIPDDLPVWAFHGLADDVVPPTGTTSITDLLVRGRLERLKNRDGTEVKVSLFEGVNHGSWDRAYRECGLAEWLLSKRRVKR